MGKCNQYDVLLISAFVRGKKALGKLPKQIGKSPSEYRENQL